MKTGSKKISSKKTYIKTSDILILSTVFMMLVFLFAGLWLETYQYKTKQLLMLQDSMDILADNQRVQFENYISQKVELLKGLVTFPEIFKMDAEEQSEFIKGRSQKLGFHHLFIMNANGTGFYIETGEYKNQRNEPFFQDVMENDVYVTEPFYGEDATIMTICVSIYDEKNEKVGALCGALELEKIQELFAENRMIQNGKSYLVNREGRYMAAEDMTKVYDKVSVYDEVDSDFTLIQEAFQKRADRNGTIIQNGTEFQANVSYLKDYDWVIVQCIETETLFKDLRYIDLGRYISLAVILVIIFCVSRIAIYWHNSEKRSETDVLTGCRSRAFVEKLLGWLDKETQNEVTVIYLDLNNFKEVNDTYGHDKGDSILCVFSEVLTEVFGKQGYVGRLGGDEFIVVLLNTLEENVAKMCNEVEMKLKEKSRNLEYGGMISTSYGYATRGQGSKEPLDDIIMKADERMYQNKNRMKEENNRGKKRR